MNWTGIGAVCPAIEPKVKCAGRQQFVFVLVRNYAYVSLPRPRSFPQRHLGPCCRFAQLRNSGSIIETGLLARHWSGVTSKGTGCALKRDALMISKLYLKYTEGRDLRAEGRIRRLLNNKSITQV